MMRCVARAGTPFATRSSTVRYFARQIFRVRFFRVKFVESDCLSKNVRVIFFDVNNHKYEDEQTSLTITSSASCNTRKREKA